MNFLTKGEMAIKMSQKRIYVVTRKRKSRKKLAYFILMPIFFMIFAGTAYVTSLYIKAEKVANESYETLDGSEQKAAATTNKVQNISVLFIGIDDSETRGYNYSTRSDALMLATFNKEDHSIKLLSIPRDSYVYVPETEEYTKINHAYAYGGTKSTIETVEELLDIDVDYYVRMNFYAFIDIVDALGGIEVNVPYDITEKNSDDLELIQIEEGIQTLNGEEALAFARTRKQDNDMERGKRQQELMEAILKKAMSAKALTKYSNVLEAVGEHMKTDLTFTQMKSYLTYFLKNSNLSITSSQLQGGDSTIDGVYYYQLDEDELEATKSSLKAHLEGIELADEELYEVN